MSARDRVPAASLLLVATGFLSAIPATGKPVLPLAAVVVLLVLAIAERLTDVRLPPSVARALDLVVVTAVLALAAAFLADRTLSLVLLTNVLIAAQLTRAIRRKTARDLATLNGTALAQVALAAFLTREAVFLPILLAAVLLGVVASWRVPPPIGAADGDLRIFVARPRGAAGLRGRVGALALPASLALGILVAGGLVFLVLPRGAHFRWGDETEQPVRDVIDPTDYSRDREDEGDVITGFSGRVELGEVGRIKRVPREAFRVRLTRLGLPTKLWPRLLYFRGSVLDSFDGKAWTRSAMQLAEERRVTNASGRGRLPVHGDIERERAGVRLVGQEYRMRATTSRMLLTLGTPTSFELDGELPSVRSLGGDSFAAPRRHAEGFVYRVTGLVPSAPDRPAVEETLSPASRAAHLRLPPGSERVLALAVEVAGQGGALEKAESIRRFLFETCEYTLLFRERPAGSPLEEFLFDTRAGHCEYFATAQAVMLRAVGVPTRLVAGYRGGLWLEDEESYFVRMSDAHAWVEAHVSGLGWVRLDPTPPDRSAIGVDPSRVPGTIAIGAPPDAAERLVFLVRNYGTEERARLLASIVRGAGFLFREGFGLGRGERPYPPPALVLLGAGAALLVGRVLLGAFRGRRRRAVPRGPGPRRKPPPEAPFYVQAVRLLARDGIVRRPQATPREFLGQVLALRGAGAEPFRGITHVFEGVRYGESPLAPPEEARVRALVSELGVRLADRQT